MQSENVQWVLTPDGLPVFRGKQGNVSVPESQQIASIFRLACRMHTSSSSTVSEGAAVIDFSLPEANLLDSFTVKAASTPDQPADCNENTNFFSRLADHEVVQAVEECAMQVETTQRVITCRMQSVEGESGLSLLAVECS